MTAVLTQRESGGNLAEVLDNLSSVMRDRFKVEAADSRDLGARADQRLGAVDGAAASWRRSCTSRQPAPLRILIDDPLGMRLVIAAVVLQLLGVYVISRMVRIEY